MDEVKVKIRISHLYNSQWKELELLVDTGATYTTLPVEVLESLGIEKSRTINLKLANGNVIKRYLGNVFLEVEGIKTPNPVIFADKNDANILGLITLESCGLMVDVVNRKLVQLSEIHHY